MSDTEDYPGPSKGFPEKKDKGLTLVVEQVKKWSNLQTPRQTQKREDTVGERVEVSE